MRGGTRSASDEVIARAVGDLVTALLIAWGLTDVLGMVGHWNLGLPDALRRASKPERSPSSESATRVQSHSRPRYGKVTGRHAACRGIAGPDPLNLLTGVHDVKVDRAPVVALSV